MIVIRIEHSDGLGPFQSDIAPNLCDGKFLQEAYNRHFSYFPVEEGFPTPRKEDLYLNKDNKEWFCGFKSIE